MSDGCRFCANGGGPRHACDGLVQDLYHRLGVARMERDAARSDLARKVSIEIDKAPRGGGGDVARSAWSNWWTVVPALRTLGVPW